MEPQIYTDGVAPHSRYLCVSVVPTESERRGQPQTGPVLSVPRVEAALQLPPSAVPSTSGEVEAIQVHDLVPGRYEVMHKLPWRIGLAINLGERTELRM